MNAFKILLRIQFTSLLTIAIVSFLFSCKKDNTLDNANTQIHSGGNGMNDPTFAFHIINDSINFFTENITHQYDTLDDEKKFISITGKNVGDYPKIEIYLVIDSIHEYSPQQTYYLNSTSESYLKYTDSTGEVYNTLYDSIGNFKLYVWNDFIPPTIFIGEYNPEQFIKNQTGNDSLKLRSGEIRFYM